MKKKIYAILMAAVMVFALTACGSSSGSEDVDLSAIDVNESEGTVTIYATLNGSFYDTSTMHYIVSEGGNQADNAMMTSKVTAQDFYDAMVKAGGNPGNTTTAKIADGEFATGQNVDVTLTWDGQDEPVNAKDSVVSDGDLKFNMIFAGNKDNNTECGSGCISCLNSCWAGVTCNNGLPFGAIDGGKPSAKLNKDTMPDDGTVIKVTFTLK